MKLNEIDHIEFELTSRCNAGCPECPRTMIKAKSGNQALDINDISLSDIKRWIPNSTPVGRIKLSGNLGDPAVHPEIYEILEYFSTFKNNIHINMHTNGGMRNPEFWKKVGELSNRGKHTRHTAEKFKLKVIWAIDGLEDTNHVYRIGVDWNKLISNLNAYNQAGGFGEWHYITFPHNEHQVYQAEQFAKLLNMAFVSRKGIRNTKPKLRANKNTHSYVDHPIINANAEVEKQQEVKEKFAATVSCQHKTNNSIFIASNSTLWPCCMLWDEHTRKKNMHSHIPQDPNWNSLNTHSIDDILNSSWYKNLDKFWTENILWRCVKSCGEQGKFTTEFERK